MYVIFPSKAFTGSEVHLKRTVITCMTITITTQNRQVLFSCQVSEEQSTERSKMKENEKETGQYRDSFSTEMVELMREKIETKRKSEDRLKDETISTQAKTFLAKKSCIFSWQDSTTQSLKIQITNTLDKMEQIHWTVWDKFK